MSATAEKRDLGRLWIPTEGRLRSASAGVFCLIVASPNWANTVFISEGFTGDPREPTIASSPNRMSFIRRIAGGASSENFSDFCNSRVCAFEKRRRILYSAREVNIR